MSREKEPALDIDDIQGHIFPGFGSPHLVVAAFKLIDPLSGRQSIASLLPEVTSMAAALQDKAIRKAALSNKQPLPPQKQAFLALSFSSRLLRAFGYSDTGYDESFRHGMKKDVHALGDPVDNKGQPVDWLFGYREEDCIDALLIGGHSSTENLHEDYDRWRSILEPHWELIHADCGRRREKGKEFFGFNDGISQPAIRGKTSAGEILSTRYIDRSDSRSGTFAKPGQRLVWPGNFIFGYEREVSGSVKPGPVFDPPQPWMKNGSYLVYRRLNQDIESFENAITALGEYLESRGASSEPEWLGSRIVGRWKDGTPVMVSPDQPNKEIGDDVLRNNNFQYQHREKPVPVTGRDGASRLIPETKGDPLGRIVPKSAHIRQVNPRAGQSEEPRALHPLKLMLRRGVTFGPEVEDDPFAERGLLFLSYQTSIVQQFLFVQSTWANSAHAPASVGMDPLIGQDGTINPQRTLTVPDMNGVMHKCPFNGRWVTATAGEYLFTPGIEGLRRICQIGQGMPPT